MAPFSQANEYGSAHGQQSQPGERLFGALQERISGKSR